MFTVTYIINDLGEEIMATLQEFGEKQKAYSDSMTRLIENIRKDVERLHDQVKRLQSSSGLNDQDKAMIDKMQLSQESLMQQLTEIDNLSEPEVPTSDVNGNVNNGNVNGNVNNENPTTQVPQDPQNPNPQQDNTNNPVVSEYQQGLDTEALEAKARDDDNITKNINSDEKLAKKAQQKKK